MPIRYTTRTPFHELSRRNRKSAYMRILNRIKRAAPVLGGKFTTHTYMHGENGWIDAYFLGTKPPISYSLALQTTICEYKEWVRSRAWELSYDLAPERELPLFDAAVKDPKTGHYVSCRREPCRYPELGNMTRLQWCETPRAEPQVKLAAILIERSKGVRTGVHSAAVGMGNVIVQASGYQVPLWSQR